VLAGIPFEEVEDSHRFYGRWFEEKDMAALISL
jgi:hypothetical protein